MANDLEIEKLIEAVHLRTPLWNKHDPMHRNLDMTNGLWKEIVAEMGGTLTVAELKQKWHNLRDCFRREVRTAETGRKKRRWIYYNQMLFLLAPECRKRKGQKNNIEKILVRGGVLFPAKLELPDEITELGLTNTCFNNSEFVENTIQENMIELGQNNFSQKTCQRETLSEDLVISNFDEGGEPSGYCRIPTENEILHTQRVAHSSRRSESTTDNDDYHFAMSIIPHMRKVPLHRKLRMRIKISEVIAQESEYCEAPS